MQSIVHKTEAPGGLLGRGWAPFRGAFPLLIASMICGCATYEPQWTPENTRPPDTIEIDVAPPEEAPATEEPASTEPSAAESPAVESAAIEAGPLTLDNVLRTAFEKNRELEVRQYSPEIVRQAIDEARAAFDPSLSATAEYSNQDRPGSQSSTSSGLGQIASTGNDTIDQALSAVSALAETTQAIQDVIDGDDTVVTNTQGFGSSLQISQPLPTGTTISLSGNYQRSAMEGGDRDYTGTWDISVTQSLLRGRGPNVNLVALRTARNNAAIGDLAFRDYALTLAQSVENAYWGLALAQETLRIREFSLELAEEQRKLNETYINVGKLSASDIVSAEAEVASQKASLVDAEANLYDSAIDLWQLMNPETQTPEDIRLTAVPLPEIEGGDFSVDASLALADKFRPDLAQARLDMENGALAVVETKNGLLPSLDAFISYGTYSNGSHAGSWNDYLNDSTYDQFSAGLQLSMTLGNRAEKARYRRAVLEEEAAHAAIRNLEQTIETEVRKAVVEVDRQREQIAASQHETAMRQKELDVETEQFRLGRSTNLDVMQVRRDFIQAKVTEATARVSYLQAVAALQATEGTLLTRRGITLETGEE